MCHLLIDTRFSEFEMSHCILVQCARGYFERKSQVPLFMQTFSPSFSPTTTATNSGIPPPSEDINYQICRSNKCKAPSSTDECSKANA